MHLGDKLWPKYAFESFENRKKSILFCIYFVLHIRIIWIQPSFYENVSFLELKLYTHSLTEL